LDSCVGSGAEYGLYIGVGNTGTVVYLTTKGKNNIQKVRAFKIFY
jgi:hypothetical protein